MRQKILGVLLGSITLLLISLPAAAMTDEDYINYELDYNKVIFIYGNDHEKLDEVYKKHKVGSPEWNAYYEAMMNEPDKYSKLRRIVEERLPEARNQWLDEAAKMEEEELKPVEGE